MLIPTKCHVHPNFFSPPHPPSNNIHVLHKEWAKVYMSSPLWKGKKMFYTYMINQQLYIDKHVRSLRSQAIQSPLHNFTYLTGCESTLKIQ